MTRLLPLLALLLVAMLVISRLGRAPEPTSELPVAAEVATPARGQSGGAAVSVGAPPPAPASATPNVDRMVTLASRQRIERERRYTYIDSLLVESDSLVRRWQDRQGFPLRVALVPALDMPGWRPLLPSLVRQALGAWQEVFPELRLDVVDDPAQADITVRWIERFEIERTGQTDLQYHPNGVIQRADILLALQTRDGQPLRDGGLLAVATHEVGHALGLPHSGDPRDVMFPDTRTGTISQRDRATLVLLYAVAPGSLRLVP